MPADPRFDGLNDRVGDLEDIVVGCPARSEQFSHRYRINELERKIRAVEQEREEREEQARMGEMESKRLWRRLKASLIGMAISAAVVAGDKLKAWYDGRGRPPATTQPNHSGDHP